MIDENYLAFDQLQFEDSILPNWFTISQGLVQFEPQSIPDRQDYMVSPLQYIIPQLQLSNKDLNGESTIVSILQDSKKQQQHLIKKRKNMDKKNKKCLSDYKKNICGYVIKKAIRQFLGDSYQVQIQQFCLVQNSNSQEAKAAYRTKLETITGPSHLPGLFQWSCPKQRSIIKVFMSFLKWFLRHRYLRHLVTQGKMEQKQVYISHKNSYLLPILAQIQQQLQIKDKNHNILLEY